MSFPTHASSNGPRRPIGPTLAASVTIALVSGVASADSAVAIASYVDTAGVQHLVEINGVVQSNGFVWFNKTVVAGTLTFTWNFNVDPDPNGNAVYNGATIVKNNGTSAVSTKTTIEFSLCPEITASSLFGGSANVKLTANANGGAITCGSGPHLVGVLINGAPTVVNYWCPFSMTSGGAGTAQTSNAFGQPFPSLPGPSVVNTIGQFTSFTVTDGDTASFTSSTIAAGVTEPMPTASCPTDVNGDGIVDKWDLISLLLAFGDSGGCLPADLNGDGVVDANDLGMLIGSWGSCSGGD